METSTSIYIAGLGIRSIDHITFGVDRALRSSKQVLYVDHGLGVREFLSERCALVTDLSELYNPDRSRADSYVAMAARVIAAAVESPPVTFGLYGHPLVFARPPFLVARAARELGLKVEILAGVSALDQILVDLMLDPCDHGLQIVEATDLLLTRRTLLSDATVLIWQVGAIGSRLFSNHASRPERLEGLRNHLLAFYPPQHVAHAIFSSPHAFAASPVISFPIGRLPDFAPLLHTGFTLVIPPAVVNGIVDFGTYASLDDPQYLERFTYRVS